MANINSTENIIIDGTPWGKERKLICLEGVWELDKIARTLPNLVDIDDSQTHFLVRALAGRMLRVTSMLMSAISDDVENEELNKFINFENGQG